MQKYSVSIAYYKKSLKMLPVIKNLDEKNYKYTKILQIAEDNMSKFSLTHQYYNRKHNLDSFKTNKQGLSHRQYKKGILVTDTTI